MAIVGPRAGLGLGALTVLLVALGGLIALRRLPAARRSRSAAKLSARRHAEASG